MTPTWLTNAMLDAPSAQSLKLLVCICHQATAMTAASSPPLPETQPETGAEASAGTRHMNPPAPGAPEAANNRKRKLEDAQQWSSAAFKLRTIFKGLRPHFLEVIRAQDFRKCEAADEIRKQMQVMMELTKQLKMEAVNIGKTKRPFTANEASASEMNVEPKVKGQVGEKWGKIGNLEELKAEEPRGTHMVGGSPLGWNFIMYPGSGPAYYGESKETFRSHRDTPNN